jgi:hypothetical protein
MADCTFATEVVTILDLRVIPDTIPTFGGDLAHDHAIEDFAQEVRDEAQLSAGVVVGNASAPRSNLVV